MEKYNNSLQIKDRRAVLRKQADEVIQAARREVRELTEDEVALIDSIKAEVEELKQAEIDLKARLDALENPADSDEQEKNSLDDDGEDQDNEIKSNNRNMKKQRFSLVKAIRDIANGQPLDVVSRAVINAGKTEATRAGVSVQGQIQLPVETREGEISVSSEGEDLVATEIWDIMTPLRARNVLAAAGAKFYTGLVGNVQIPIMTAANVGWEGEIASAKDAGIEFSHKTLSPKRLTAYVDISKMLLAQDSVDVENAIRTDLINAISTKLEQTILSDGEGSATVPEGIFHAVSAEECSSFADLCDLEASVEDANVLGECVYVLSNKAKSAIRQMAKGDNVASSVYYDGTIDGVRALNTSHVEDSGLVYGDFSNLAIGNWAGIDLCVDPYTKAADGQVRIVVNAFFDAQILRAEAFATGEIVSE